MPTPITGGIWPAVLSAVDTDGNVDLDAMDQLVELFIEQGLGGLYIVGSTGQGPALSMETRKTLCERICKTNANRLPVMVHVGAVSVYDAVELAKHAADCGADAISSVPPIYFPVDVKLTFKHYELIAGATDLPFMPYHTGFNNIALPSADEYARLLKELPHFAGVKLTEANFVFFTVLREQLGDDYVLFSGFDEMFMLGVMSGADGAIGTWMNLWGPAFKKVDAEFRKGNIALGKKFTREFMDTAMPLVFEKSNFAPFISHAMRLEYNIDIGPGRGPFYVSDATFADDFVRSTIDRVNAAAEL